MYLRLQAEKIKSDSPIYSFLNALGSPLIRLSLDFKFDLSVFIIEIFWLLVSVYGLSNHFRESST